MLIYGLIYGYVFLKKNGNKKARSGQKSMIETGP